MAELDDHTPEEILSDSQVFDIDFHPLRDVVALGSITGVVEVYVERLRNIGVFVGRTVDGIVVT
jgi:hypothetical protein